MTFASSPARAQPPSSEVQPVPYAPSQPVPYALPPSVAPTPAPFASAGPVVQGNDVVTLKDGGMIRGVLIESIPADHATVQLATGQTAIIPWDRIARIERATAGSPPAKAAPPPPPMAFVHVESDRPVRLERHEVERNRRGDWKTVCEYPCDQPVPLTGEYRVAGDGVRTSAPFQLNGQPGERLQLSVNTGSKGGLVGGIVLTSLGPLVALIGVAVEVTASAETQLDGTFSTGNTYTTPTDHSTAKGVGYGMMIGGLVMMVGGIVMLASNAHTKVTTDTGAGARSEDAWLRLPTWQADPMEKALPRTAETPLFHTSF